jgi:hypothetical protein
MNLFAYLLQTAAAMPYHVTSEGGHLHHVQYLLDSGADYCIFYYGFFVCWSSETNKIANYC